MDYDTGNYPFIHKYIGVLNKGKHITYYKEYNCISQSSLQK